MGRRLRATALALLGAGGAGPGAACTSDPLPERRRTVYGPFEDEVYAILEREMELMAPRDLADVRVAALRSLTDEPRAPGLYVRDALRAAVAPPVDTDLRQTLESPAALALFDDGGMRRLGEFVAASLDRVLDETRPGGAAARAPEALEALHRAAGGPNPDAVLHLLHRLAMVQTVEIPDAIPGEAGGGPSPEEVDASLVPGLVKLYERQADGVLRLHDFVAAELQTLAADGDGGAPDEVSAAARDLLAPICPQVRDLGMGRVCAADFAALALGAPTYTVRTDALGGLARTPEGEDMGDILPFANVSQAGERRGADPLSDVGQAFDPLTGIPAFEYEDVKASLAALLLDAQRRLLARGALWDLVGVLPALLGERTPAAGLGYDPDDDVILDLLWAFKELRTYPRWPILMRVQAELFADGEGLRRLHELLGAFGRAYSVVRGPDILSPRNELFDHLAGQNPLRDLEVGKPCGGPLDTADLCSSGWLRCGFPAGRDRTPTSVGACAAAAPTPSILEELAEPGGWWDAGGAWVAEPSILRRIFRAMARDARLLDMGEGMARMMESAVHNDLAPVFDRDCADLSDASVADLHARGFAAATQWDEPEGQPDPLGLADDADPTRSFNQKLLELIYDTNRAPYDPDVLGQEGTHLLLIPNQATFYMDAAVGNVDIDARYVDGDPEESFAEQALNGSARQIMCETGLADDDGNGLTPRAEQLNLFMLRSHVGRDFIQDTGNPRGNLGFELRTHLASMLVAGVATGNLEALRPLLDVFSRYGQQDDAPRNIRLPGGRTQVFVDALSTLHMHTSEHVRNKDRAFDAAARRPTFDRQYGTGLRRTERRAVAIVRDPRSNKPGGVPTDFFAEQVRFGALLDRTEVCLERTPAGPCAPGRTVNAADEIVAFVAWLVDRDAVVRPRPARHEDWGVVAGQDGLLNGPMTGRRDPTVREPRPSRLHLLIEAFRLVDDRLLGQPEALAAWRRLDLLDVLVGVGPEDGALANPGAPWAVRGLVALMAGKEERAFRDAGCDPLAPPAEGCAEYEAELERSYGRAVDFVSAPGFAQTVALLTEIRADDELRRWLDTLLALNVRFDADPELDVAGALLELIAHALQIAADGDAVVEVVRYLGSVLEADAWIGKELVPTLGRLDAADELRAVPALLRNLTTEDRTRVRSRFPLRTLKDLFSDALRVDPAVQGPFDAADYRQAVARLRDFFLDDVSGFQRAVDVVVSRLPR